VYGKGDQTRSFCYVDDQVEGLIRLMNSEHMGPINIGNPGEYTILQLAKTVQNIINPKAEIVFKPLPSDDPKKRKPDITKARKLLGWEPKIQLEEGLKHTIADFKSRMDKEAKLREESRRLAPGGSLVAAEEKAKSVENKCK